MEPRATAIHTPDQVQPVPVLTIRNVLAAELIQILPTFVHHNHLPDQLVHIAEEVQRVPVRLQVKVHAVLMIIVVQPAVTITALPVPAEVIILVEVLPVPVDHQVEVVRVLPGEAEDNYFENQEQIGLIKKIGI